MLSIDVNAPARLLVVDDEAFVRNLLARWLRDEGYECATANCATAAREYLAQHPVDLVTLDITMPGCSGLDLLDEIRRAYPDTTAHHVDGRGRRGQGHSGRHRRRVRLPDQAHRTGRANDSGQPRARAPAAGDRKPRAHPAAREKGLGADAGHPTGIRGDNPSAGRSIALPG